MQDDEVKALAERIMNFEIENPFRKITDPPQKVKLSRALTQKEAEALARVALEYAEGRERNLAGCLRMEVAKLLSGRGQLYLDGLAIFE